MMLLRLVWALALTTSITCVGAQGFPLRRLEESGDGDKDFSGLYAKYSNCFRVKIQDDNDDDAEGNSYFYNGKYYAQYATYAAFHMCSADECGKDSCDSSTGYVTDLETYLESNVEFVQEYCNACVNQCRRRLEDEAEEEEEDEEEYEDENDVGGGDLLDMGGLSVQDYHQPDIQLTQVCTADKSGGLDIFAGFYQKNSTVCMDVEFFNVSCPAALSTLAIQLNKNSFGLSPANQQIVCNPEIGPGSNGRNTIELVVTPNMLAPIPAGQPGSPQVQVAIKNMGTGNVFYFAANFAFEALFSPDGALDRSAFIEAWKSIDDTKELYGTVSDLPASSTDIDAVQAKFKAYNVFFIARRPVPNAEGQEVVYFSMRTVSGMDFLAELTFKQGVNACKVCLKTENAGYGAFAKTALEKMLRE
mmetsp:Transcript_6931/g.11471  ORF Transcript_6931/g.11471 Transcript_6931/m.11471 type:complete len:417 (+) Transcript_6931:68-1318(+)